MNTLAVKTKEIKNQSIADVFSQKQNDKKPAVKFVDNRPESIAQRKLQELATNGNQTQQVARLQAMMNQHVPPIQRKTDLVDQPLLQGKSETTQRQKEEELLQGRIDTVQRQALEDEELIQGKFDTIQRLAMKYGDHAPIPESAQEIAIEQNAQRGEDIPTQTIPGDIEDEVFTKMGDQEKIYIVAHGRAPIGNEPPVLQGGDGNVLSGSDVAGIISNIKTGLEGEDKTIGDVKIEACMSSLSRKTKSGFLFGETFIKAKPSLITNIKNSLQNTYHVNDVVLSGNPGFSTGSEFEEEGVQNLSPANTELGLLVSVLELLCDAPEEDWRNAKYAAIKKDGLNIIRKFGPQLENFDRDSQVGEKIEIPTADYVRWYINVRNKASNYNNIIFTIALLLSRYIRTSPDD